MTVFVRHLKTSLFTFFNFVLLAGLICLAVSSATAQSGVGVKTDLGVYPEGQAPTLPAAGGKLTDPVFGTQIMRVTDQTDGPFFGTAYSYWSTFNSNNTRLLVQNSGGSGLIYQFDPASFTLGAKAEINATTEDAIWSAYDPNTLFTHGGASFYAYNAQTRSYSLVGNLNSQFPAGSYFAQMSVSRDDDVFAFTVRNADYSVGGYAVWKRSTNTVIHSVATTSLDEVQIDKTGRYLVVKTGEQGYGVIEVKVVDLQTQTVTNLTDNAPDFAPGHSDNGGGSVVGEDNWNNRLTYRNLASPRNVRTVIQWSAWDASTHISMLADNEDWFLISTYGNNTTFNRELVLVATDGSQRVKRLAHHYSLVNNYGDSPRANISRDGKFIAFTSNWGGSGRRDLFVAQVPTDTVITPASYESDVAPRPNGNGDGKVTVADITQIGLFVAGIVTPNPLNELQRADSAPRTSKGNGAITISDYIQASRYAAGVDAVQTAGGPSPANLPRFTEDGELTKEGLAFLSGENILQSGEIDSGTFSALSRSVRVVNKTASAGQQVLVSIETDSIGDENGFGFTVNYDSTKLANPVVSLGTDAVTASTFIPNTQEVGKVGVVLAFPSGQAIQSGTRQLATIRFNVTTSASGLQTALTFSDAPVVREVVNANADVLTTTFTNGVVTVLGPTPASVIAGGRVTKLSGEGVSGAKVSLTDPNGATRTAVTNSLGYYRFTELTAGGTFVLSVSAKKLKFTPQTRVRMIVEDTYDINFTSDS